MAPARGGKKPETSIIGLDADEIANAPNMGSLHISEEELNAAFEFFDIDGTVRRQRCTCSCAAPYLTFLATCVRARRAS